MANKENRIRRFGYYLLGKLKRQQRDPKSGEGKTRHQETDKSSILNVYRPPQKSAVAQVILNGYNIDQAMSFGVSGAMRSFRVIYGDLWEEWNEQVTIILTNGYGEETLAKVAALPVDDNSFGLLEFVS